MTKSKKSLLVGLGVALVFGVALVVYGENRPLKRTFFGSVKDLLPTEAEVPGWKVEYLPIADTPEMQAKVNELLNYDDAVYAVYTKGTERISIYIAYWTPGKMSERLIAGHTPDVCWVGAGWRILKAESGKAGVRNLNPETGNLNEPDAKTYSGLSPQVSGLPIVSGLSAALSASKLFSVSDFESAAPVARAFSALKSQVSSFDINAGERRLMERNGQTEQVAFWHVSGDKIISYGIGKPKWRAAIAETSDAFGQRGEQIFIRISRGVAHRRTVGQIESDSVRVATGQGPTRGLFGSSEKT